MAARAVALAAVALLAAGCGGRLYSDRDAARAAGAPVTGRGVSQPELRRTPRPFATFAAVTDLELDANPAFASLRVGRGLWVIRYSSAHDAQTAVREGDIRAVDAKVIAGVASPVVTVRRNLVLVGARAAVDAALRRLP